MLDDFLEIQYRGDKEKPMTSILKDVKHKVGPSEDYDYFDRDILDAINSAFGTLTQLGVGPKEGFSIEDDTTTWDAYTTNVTELNLVRDYVYKRVRVIFDPPSSSFVLSSMNDQIKELEWRLNVQVDPKEG